MTQPERITVETRLADDLCAISGDPAQLTHALLHLCVNAVEAMAGNGRLSLETDSAAIEGAERPAGSEGLAPGRYARVRIRDTGCGMSAETAERCFEPFLTAGAQGGGAGLGLTMVNGTIATHRGSVSVASSLGDGTTVTIYLPALAEEDFPRQAGQPRAATRGSVLLVDDEVMVRTAAGRLLRSLGYQVLMASNGKEAVELYQAKKDEVVLVILDLVMPEMNGAVVFEKLRALDPEVRVLLASGHDRELNARELIDRGARGFLQKPYVRDELRRAMDQALA